jgi:hypothetical protein
MGRVLLFAAAVVLGFFVLGAVLGLLMGLLKWILLLGAIALGVAVTIKLIDRTAGRQHSPR